MSPEKMAIAVAVTMAAMAGIGAMKNVTGTSSAVAIVAVRPGTAPTNRPNSDAASITTMVCGANTMEAALSQASSIGLPGDRLQHAPGERHAQQLVEDAVHGEREQRGEGQ